MKRVTTILTVTTLAVAAYALSAPMDAATMVPCHWEDASGPQQLPCRWDSAHHGDSFTVYPASPNICPVKVGVNGSKSRVFVYDRKPGQTYSVKKLECEE